MDHATSYASFNTVCYLLIQGNIHPRFNFAPFALHVYGRIWNCANCIGLNYLFLKTTYFGQIQDRMKLFASEKGWK